MTAFRTLLAWLLGFAAAPLAIAADHPSHELKTDELAVKVYLPDAEKGFYRGTRFDWSGVLSVEFAKHKIFGPWKDKHDPKNNDDIVGPCEEFGSSASSPLHYKDAKVGETFLKIGVGELKKPKENGYRFFHNYEIAKAGTWTIDKAEKKISFAQELSTESGYGYKYTKTVLVDGATLRLLHVLENTGKKAISTDVYNHNFFNVDGDPIGPNYTVTFNFDPKAGGAKDRFDELVAVRDKALTLKATLDKGSIYTELGGFDTKDGSQDAGFAISHKPSAVTVRVSSTKAPSRFNVWGMKTTLCPEPFHQLDIEPGKKATWTWKYDFKAEK